MKPRFQGLSKLSENLNPEHAPQAEAPIQISVRASLCQTQWQEKCARDYSQRVRTRPQIFACRNLPGIVARQNFAQKFLRQIWPKLKAGIASKVPAKVSFQPHYDGKVWRAVGTVRNFGVICFLRPSYSLLWCWKILPGLQEFFMGVSRNFCSNNWSFEVSRKNKIHRDLISRSKNFSQKRKTLKTSRHN